MLKLLGLLILLQAAGTPDVSIKFRDRAVGATPVTDKDLRPMKAPDCKTEAEIQRTLVQLSQGEPGDCFIRDMRRLSSR